MLEPLSFVLLATAGGVGAGCRFLLDSVIHTRIRGSIPLGTLIINVSGSLALGFVTGIATLHLMPSALALVLGTGLLGGYTTFSTASFEVVQLLRERKWMPALIAGPGMLVLTVLAAAAGLGLAVLP